MPEMINDGHELMADMEYDLWNPNCRTFEVGGTSRSKKEKWQKHIGQEVWHSHDLRMFCWSKLGLPQSWTIYVARSKRTTGREKIHQH